MVSDIQVFPFSRPVNVRPGDTLCVSHACPITEKALTLGGKPATLFIERDKQYLICKHEADFEATWSYSILFRVGGQMQWLLGNDDTISWLKGLQNENT